MEEDGLNGAALVALLGVRVQGILDNVQVKRRQCRTCKVLKLRENYVERPEVIEKTLVAEQTGVTLKITADQSYFSNTQHTLVEHVLVIGGVDVLGELVDLREHESVQSRQLLIGSLISLLESVQVAQHEPGSVPELADALGNLAQDGLSDCNVFGVL